MSDRYKVIIGSPVNYDCLTADIIIDGRYICFLQQEEGPEKLIIEFYSNSEKVDICLDDFLEAIATAKNMLLK
jgi:hypothetical protein